VRCLYGVSILAQVIKPKIELKIKADYQEKQFRVGIHDKPVVELARALLSFKQPTGFHRTATVAIIRNFHFG